MRKLFLLVFAIVAINKMSYAQQQNDSYTNIDTNYFRIDSLGNIYCRFDVIDADSLSGLKTKAMEMMNSFNLIVGYLWDPCRSEDCKQMKTSKQKEALRMVIAEGGQYSTMDSTWYMVYGEKGNYHYYLESDTKHVKPQISYNPQKRLWKPTKQYILQQLVYGERIHWPAQIEITSKYNKQRKKTTTIKNYLTSIMGNANKYDKVRFVTGGYHVSDLKRDEHNRYVGIISYWQEFTGANEEGGTYHDCTYRTVKYYVYFETEKDPDGKPVLIWKIRLGDILARATTDEYKSHE